MLIVIIQPYINSLNLQAYHNKYHIDHESYFYLYNNVHVCIYAHAYTRT